LFRKKRKYLLLQWAIITKLWCHIFTEENHKHSEVSGYATFHKAKQSMLLYPVYTISPFIIRPSLPIVKLVVPNWVKMKISTL